jgi:hypothetical protein
MIVYQPPSLFENYIFNLRIDESAIKQRGRERERRGGGGGGGEGRGRERGREGEGKSIISFDTI